MTEWTISEGLEFLRLLWPKLQDAGWHCALTGSVLYRGDSTKDLDVVFFPRNQRTIDLSALATALRGVGARRLYSKEFVQERWKAAGVTDTKHVEVWRYQGKRIDAIVWPGGAP